MMRKRIHHLPEEEKERIKHNLKRILENHNEIKFALLKLYTFRAQKCLEFKVASHVERKLKGGLF